MDGNSKIYLDKLGTETSWKATKRRTEEGNGDVFHRENYFENEKLSEVVQILVQLRPDL